MSYLTASCSRACLAGANRSPPWSIFSGTAKIHRPGSASRLACFWMSSWDWPQLTPAQHSRLNYNYTPREGVCKGYILACAPIGHVNCNCLLSRTTFCFRPHNDALYGELPVQYLVDEVWRRMFLAGHPELAVRCYMSYGYFAPSTWPLYLLTDMIVVD